MLHKCARRCDVNCTHETPVHKEGRHTVRWLHQPPRASSSQSYLRRWNVHACLVQAPNAVGKIPDLELLHHRPNKDRCTANNTSSQSTSSSKDKQQSHVLPSADSADSACIASIVCCNCLLLTSRIAVAMGKKLAMIHWQVGCNARGVKFVRGCNSHQRLPFVEIHTLPGDTSAMDTVLDPAQLIV